MIKKQLIMEKALELFAQQGIEATSIQQITERSGISKGAFYLSFKSKDELILSIIDYFMADFSATIDHIVKNTTQPTDLLYKYFYTLLSLFKKQAGFAKMLLTDLPKTINDDLFKRLHYYNGIISEQLINIIDIQFPHIAPQMKVDHVYFVRGLVGMYTEQFIHCQHTTIDLHQLCNALVEKVTILAEHATIPAVSKEALFLHQEMELMPKERILHFIELSIAELQQGLQYESLLLLQQQLHGTSLPPTIVEGLLNNLYVSPSTKWISLLIRTHLKLD